MASATGFTSFVTEHTICSRKATTQFTSVFPVKKRHQHQLGRQKSIHKVVHRQATERRQLKLFAAPSNDFHIYSHSPEQAIVLFYSAINGKKLAQVDDLLAEDCFFEDYSFPKPFQGKKETMRFLEQLTSCMGQNMQFSIDNICEGNHYAVVVNWHLDWNKIQVPFTKGCSYYTLFDTGDKLVIKKGQVHIESPIKLGGLVLTIFKIMTSLFDAFPAMTEWFLKSPHVIFQLLLKTYKIAVKPVISPFIEWYIKLLNFTACILSFTLKLMYYLAKIFNM